MKHFLPGSCGKGTALIHLFLFTLLVAGSNPLLYAQTPPAKQWDKTFGGSGGDIFVSLQQTSDGGYILGGISNSNASGDKSEDGRGGADFWIVKLNAAGMKEWDKTLGGSDEDGLSSLQQTSDGGFILGGGSNSNASGDKSETAKGGSDYWIVKLAPETIEPYAQITGFTLINADTNADIIELKDGDQIDLNALGFPTLSVRANTKPATVDSVIFELNGPGFSSQVINWNQY